MHDRATCIIALLEHTYAGIDVIILVIYIPEDNNGEILLNEDGWKFDQYFPTSDTVGNIIVNSC